MSGNERVTVLNEYLTEGIKNVNGWCLPQLWQAIWPIYRLIGDGPIAEIGVYEGKFFIGLCKTFGIGVAAGAVAIDVFDMQEFNLDGAGEGKKDVFRHNLAINDIALDRVKIIQLDSLSLKHRDAESIVSSVGEFNFFSVDGCHEVVHTINDVEFAMKVTAHHGLIAVDDYTNSDWPGVSEGIARMYLMRSYTFCPLAIIANKLLLCSYSYHEKYLKSIESYIRAAHSGTRVKKIKMFGFDALNIYPDYSKNTPIFDA